MGDKRRKLSILSSLILFFLVLPYANATTLSVEYGHSKDLTWDKNNKVGALVGIWDGTSYQYYTGTAGEFIISFDDGTERSGFCVDFLTGINTSETYTLTGVSAPEDYTDGNYYYGDSKTSGQYAEWLIDTFAVGMAYTQSKIYNNSSDLDDIYAALQLAIWDAVWDFKGKDWDTTNDYGDFRFYTTYSGNDDVDVWYQYFKDELKDNYSSDSSGEYQVLLLADKSGKGAQSLITTTPVPEPSTLLLFGFGLLGVGAMGRKITWN